MLGIKNVFVSGLVYATRFDVSLLQKVHVLILDFYTENRFIYIDNRNIGSDSLYKDGLHLNDKWKAYLADNFIVYSNVLLETHTHHPQKKN